MRTPLDETETPRARPARTSGPARPAAGGARGRRRSSTTACPGLLWVGAVGGAVLLARWFLVKPRPELPEDWLRKLAPYLIGLLVVVAIATAGEWSRIADFSRLSALNPDRFGSDLGNLAQALSPLEALGIWPAGEFDATPASAGAAGARVFYLGALIGLAALVLGLLRDRRERDWTLPALLVAMAGVYVLAALFSSPYIAAKALAILAPVVIAIALRGTLGAARPGAGARRRPRARARRAPRSWSSASAPVGPDDTRPSSRRSARSSPASRSSSSVATTSSAGSSRGSGEITGIVTNFYDVEDARPRFKKGEGGGEKFDVDAVFPQTLDSFRYILATTGGPASVVPPRFHEVERTDDYVLYEHTGQHRQAPHPRRGHRPRRRPRLRRRPSSGRSPRARARRSSGTSRR